jgi:hypothetical protein
MRLAQSPLLWGSEGFSKDFKESSESKGAHPSHSQKARTGQSQKCPPPRGTEGSNPSPSSGESVSRGTLSLRVKNPGFPRGCAGLRSRRGRQRPEGAHQHRTNPQQYLCRAIFQYRISGDAVATSYRVKVARPVPKPGRASSRLRDAGGSCELGSGSSKAERGPLIVPAERQTGVREQLLCRQIARLAPV